MTNITPLPNPPVPQPPPAAHPAPVWRGVIPTGMDDSLRMAKVIVASGIAPRALFADGADPIAAVWSVIQLGAEVGLSPMAAVQNICLINGRPGLFGPAMLAVVEASGLLDSIEERIEGEGDQRRAVCTVKRIGRLPRTVVFSVPDAKTAGLWDKRGRNGAPGPWQQYPDRMLQARARSFALRDVFPDVLMGLAASVEELQDIPADEDEGRPAPRAKTVRPEPAADVPKPPPTLDLVLADGEIRSFPKTRRSIPALLDLLERELAHPAPMVMLEPDNIALLNNIAKLPEFAPRVAELRAAANKALMPDTDLTDEALGIEDIDYDPNEDGPERAALFRATQHDSATGEVDPMTERAAVRRGAVPSDTQDSVLPPA